VTGAVHLGGWVLRWFGDEAGPPTGAQLTPVDDLREHVENPECWCRPVRDPEADLRDGLWVHNSMDNREAYEEGSLSRS
jgi:hypothetical protein